MAKVIVENLLGLGEQKFSIKNYSVDVVDLQLISPMKLPFGEIKSRPSGTANIEIQTQGKRYSGFGEGATLPEALFTDDSGKNIEVAATTILSSLSGKEVTFGGVVREIGEFSFSDEGSHPTARMMVEMSIIDALSVSNKKSVAESLQIPETVAEVTFGKSLGGGTFDQIVTEAESSIRLGAKKIKLKVSPATTEVITQVVKHLNHQHPQLELMVDANGTFDPTESDDIQSLKRLDKLDLVMIEEPVSRVGKIRGYPAAELLRSKVKLSTKICLDDCLVDLATTKKALYDGVADIVNIKPGRIGSIVGSLGIADLSKSLNKQVMVGGMLEATPGRTMTTVLAAKFSQMGFNIPGDLSLAQERLIGDLVPNSRQLSIGPNGGIIIPRNPGWGY